MTRHAYLLSNIAILAAICALALLFQEALLDPAVAWLAKAPFARIAHYWLAGVLFVIWLISAPAWSWASLRRLRFAGHPGWWSLVPSGLGLVAIVIVWIGGHTLGAELRGIDAYLPPPDTISTIPGPSENPILITWLLRFSGFVLTVCAAITLAVMVIALGPERPREDGYSLSA